MNAEQQRLNDYQTGKKNWMRWGSYLSERQWGTVREDYSAGGDAWNYFPHHQAISRVYRWGEDGIAGISDENQFLCFAITVWNGKDPILKERLFGLTNGEGNHGEDVKELYYYLDNTPSHSYMKYLYKYPQQEFPYTDLLNVNRSRNKTEPEYELLDTGVFNDNRYFDISTEYAKAEADDMLIRITISNRADEAATLHLLPTLWFRNTWKFGLTKEKVNMQLHHDTCIVTQHENLPPYFLYFQQADKVLFTENKNNKSLLWNVNDKQPCRKDAFHKALLLNDFRALDEKKSGTKAAPMYFVNLEAGESKIIYLRLSVNDIQEPFDAFFDDCFTQRKNEADIFYKDLQKPGESDAHAAVRRQALAGMLWSKQFYYYDVNTWLQGDAHQPAPPAERWQGRNNNWQHVKAADIISMPDKWEYPWFAAWDLAFHSIAIAEVDIAFAKKQLLLLFGSNYSSPDGQLPAYEWNFSDVNPPVQALAALEICRIEKEQTGKADLTFLQTIYPLLLKNYNWWLAREDDNHNNVFEGGFLGLDNISVFDRSHNLPEGGRLDQADGTAWMASFSLCMLEIALQLCNGGNAYEDDCISYFNHFVQISNSLQQIAQCWADDNTIDDGFFYDVLQLQDGRSIPVKLRSIAGIIPLLATTCLNKELLNNAPRLKTLLHSFDNTTNKYQIVDTAVDESQTLLSLLTPAQLQALLPVLFSEDEMLSPGGIRSISKVYENGFVLDIDGVDYGLKYMPGESDNGMYGGNSNWRGPVWMPLNYLIIRALRKYAAFYQQQITFNFSGDLITLGEAASELSMRLLHMFLPDDAGSRPVHGNYDIYQTEHFEDLILFYEHFHAETAHGIGASHQTGWTGLAAAL
ncbi:MAG: glucosidase [Bacteroidetes bacterium]|nr:glucosidase [Bacteroidota bacterium]